MQQRLHEVSRWSASFVVFEGVEALSRPGPGDPDKARRDLGYAPQVPLREGVRLAATWYQHQDSRALGNASVGAPQAAKAK